MVMVPLIDSSMDKIFDVIGVGYFCSSRFGEEIVGAIPSIVPLTRVLWQKTKGKMLPTPAKVRLRIPHTVSVNSG